MTRSKRRISPFLSRCCGSLSVSPWRMSALRMPCSSMFILQMAQVPPLMFLPGKFEIAGVAARLLDVVLATG